jgi:penicillin-binding protein 1C
MRTLPSLGMPTVARIARIARRPTGLVLVFWIAWRILRLAVAAPDQALLSGSWLEGTRVLARDGRVLGERASPAGLRGRWTTLDDAGERLVLATLTSEDRRFYAHDGVDRRALARALVVNVTRGRIVSGGSTITQQLVKRVDHQGRPRPRSLAAKVLEIARAQNLDASLDKRTLLEAYLNHLDYGRGYAGPEAAAEGYFAVHAKNLSLAQAALLAVLPRAPSALDPYRHRERAVLRQRALLRAMHDEGLVSSADLDRALKEPLVLRDRTTPSPFVAPHVVLAAAQKETGDVVTTLDFELQRDVEALVDTHASRLHQKGATNAAVVVVDNATGDVLAAVGSAGFFDAKIHGAVDVLRARRQPGSTLKPFVYARAFERGTSPTEMLADVRTDFGGAYAPDNFDGTFQGPISAREALAGSLNVPAVKLAQELGADELVRVLRASGLTLREGARSYGLSVALGSGEVTPLELAEAYVTLARGGEHIALRHRKSAPLPTPERVLDPAAVAAVTDALSDSLARVRGLRARGPFELPFPVAIKTGTSTAYRDAWTSGFTRERTVVVWVGNANGAPTDRLTGAVGAGPLFTDVMKRAMTGSERAPLTDPGLLEEARVCPLSGHRPSPACPGSVLRRFPHGNAPKHSCTVHQLGARRGAPRGEPPWRCSTRGTERLVLLPDGYARWLADRPVGAPGADPQGIPWLLASRVPGCAPPHEGQAQIVVLSPRDGAVLHADRSRSDAVDVQVTTSGLSASERLEVVLDGRVALSLDAPYRGRLPLGPGDHLVEVRPVDGRVAAALGRAQVSVR